MNIDKLNDVLDEITPDEFKEDKSYSYIVGLRPDTNTFESGGGFHIDMFHEMERVDNEKIAYMKSMVENKLFGTSKEKAIELAGIKETPPLNEMFLRARMNPGITIHIFHTKFKVERQYFEFLAQTMYCESSKKLWRDSRIH